MTKERIPLPIKDLRESMVIRLAVAPKHIVKGVASDSGDNRYRKALIDHLTWGWGALHITTTPSKAPSFNPTIPAEEPEEDV